MLILSEVYIQHSTDAQFLAVCIPAFREVDDAILQYRHSVALQYDASGLVEIKFTRPSSFCPVSLV